MKRDQSLSGRRDFMRGIASAMGLALVVSPRLVRDAHAADAQLRVAQISEHLYVISGAGSNVVVSPGANSLAVIDSGLAANAQLLRQTISTQISDLPIELLFNTHWHVPHTGGNDVLGDGASIIAHENTRLWMSTEFYVDWEDRRYSARAAAALPTATFFTSDQQPLVQEFDDRVIEYGHLLEAHTDGDIYVRFPDDNVIVVGDALTVGAYPTPDHATGGWIGGLINATAKLIELGDSQTKFVPGTGPVQNLAALEAQHGMLNTILDRMEPLIRQGKSSEEIIAAGITAEFDPLWGDPTRFLSNVYDGHWWGSRIRGVI